jgi:hydrogenase/urease accessory protein HupE
MSRRGVLLLALLLVPRVAGAHPAPFSYLDLRLPPGRIEASIVLHIADLAHELQIDPADRLLDPAFVREHQAAIAALVAARLQVASRDGALGLVWSDAVVLADRHAIGLSARAAVDRVPGRLTIQAALFPYDPAHQTFVNVYEGGALTQALVDRSRARFEYFSGTRQGVAAVVARFVPEGIRHILIGPDHLLFLVGLLLLGGSVRRLAVIVTAFTVAHSVTLSLAALNVLAPPARLIEPAIALSIVYVGADNLLIRRGRDTRAWIALAFGFIHGFGFASVLREMGLPAQALGWSLFSFNLGVEIGQLVVVVAVASVLAALRARSETVGRSLAWGGSVAVIAIGAFWFVERLVSPGGL